MGGGSPRSGPHRHVPPPHASRIPERDSRSARARRRRHRAAAERRCELRLRQRGRGRIVADACSNGISPRRRKSRRSRSAVRCRRRAAASSCCRSISRRKDHVDGLPFGTRGGTAVRHTFPRDGDYEIQVRLMRNRNENVEGLSEPHQIEITLDGERLQVFTVTPNRNRFDDYYADEAVDKHLHLRTRVTAGPHVVGATFPGKARRAHRDRAPAVRRALQHEPASAAAAGGALGVDRRVRSRPSGVGETPSRARIFVVPSRRRGAEAECARTIVTAFARRAYRRPVTDRDVAVAAPVLFQGERERRIRCGHRDGAARAAHQPGVPVPRRSAILKDCRTALRIASATWSWRRGCRSSSGAASPTSNCSPRPSADVCANRPRSRPQVKRMLADSASGVADDELRESVAVSAQPRRRGAESAAVSRLRRQPAAGLPARDGTLLSEHRAGEPQRPRPARRRLHVPQRARRQALRRSERLRRSVPTRLAARRQRAPRTARAGQHSHGDVALDAHVAGAARQVDPRQHHGHAAAAAARQCSAAEGKRTGQPGADDAAADGGAPEQSGMRDLSCEHRSARVRARELRRDRPLADVQTRRDSPIDASGSLPGGATFDGVRGLRRALLARPDVFVGTLTEKLLTYALGRGVDYNDAPAVRQIRRDAAADDYRFSIARCWRLRASTPFQMRSRAVQRLRLRRSTCNDDHQRCRCRVGRFFAAWARRSRCRCSTRWCRRCRRWRRPPPGRSAGSASSTFRWG